MQDKLPLLEWLANNYKKFGCTLEFVTNKCVTGLWQGKQGTA